MTHPSSYFTWLPLPPGGRADRIAAALNRSHISVSTAEPFSTTSHVPQALRVALGSANLDILPAALTAVRCAIEADLCL